MAAKERALKRMMRNATKRNGKAKLDERFEKQENSSAEISEIEEEGYANHEEGDADQTFRSMMHAAASLAELRVRSQQQACMQRGSMPTTDQKMVDNSIEALSKAHADTVAAKDELIQTVNATLLVKEELIRTQAALISAMKQQYVVTAPHAEAE